EKKKTMFAMAMPRSSTGHVLDDHPVAEVVTREGGQARKRQLLASVARRRIRRRDQLHAEEGLLCLAADELVALDRALEIVEKRAEPGDVAGIHPIRGYGLPLETPGSGPRSLAAAGCRSRSTLARRSLAHRDLDVVVLDADGAPLAVDRVHHLAHARVTRQ